MADEQHCYTVGEKGVTKITDYTSDVDNIVTNFSVFGTRENGDPYFMCDVIGLPVIVEYKKPEEIK